MATILQMGFSNSFLEGKKMLYFDLNLIEICSQGSSVRNAIVGSDDGLVLMRQTIVWTNDGLVCLCYWCIYALLTMMDSILMMIVFPFENICHPGLHQEKTTDNVWNIYWHKFYQSKIPSNLSFDKGSCLAYPDLFSIFMQVRVPLSDWNNVSFSLRGLFDESQV